MIVQDVVNLIKKSIINKTNFYQYKDMIIIGENTSGKSKMLKDSIKALINEGAYFIDCKNRVIPTTRGLMADEFNKFKVSEIVGIRIKKDNFNKKDIFSIQSDSEVVLEELIKNNNKYKKLFKEVLDIEMEYEEPVSFVNDELEQIYINSDNLREISSGIQSMLRILMEVNFASENMCKVVFIDEFNTNLDHKTSSEYFMKLRKKYSNIRFIITTHNIYTLRGVDNADVIKIYKDFEKPEDNSCEIFDSNDLDNLEVIDRNLFSGTTERNGKDEKDILLSNALKIFLSSGTLDDGIKDTLKSISNLTLRQNIVYNYIFERVKE